MNSTGSRNIAIGRLAGQQLTTDRPMTVKYHLLSSMLLNELEKLNQRCVERDEANALRLEQLQAQNEDLLARVRRLESTEAEVASLRASLQAFLDNR